MAELELGDVGVWGTERVLKFRTAQALLDWCQTEKAFWELPLAPRPQNSAWMGHLQNQISQVQQLHSAAQTFAGTKDEASRQNAMRDISRFFQDITNGTLLTSDSKGASSIRGYMENRAEVAPIVYAFYRSDANELLNRNSLNTKSMVELALQRDVFSTDKALETTQLELVRLKNEYQSDIAQLRTFVETAIAESKATSEAEKEAVNSRDATWQQTLTSHAEEWSKLKKTYDTELGLRAPTTYWSTRASTSTWHAFAYAGIFVVSVVALLLAFFFFAVPHLQSVKDQSPFLLMVPVLVPLLCGVWVLRVVARIFSETVKISQDARERETLVKTFLALMKDETAGKSVVADEDRKIILQALFRQSAVTAADDSPPFSVAELFKGPSK